MPLPYFDAHCDTLSRCLQTGDSLYRNNGQFDLERQARYSPAGQIFAIFHNYKGRTAQTISSQYIRQAALFAQWKQHWPVALGQGYLSVEGSELLGCYPDNLDIAHQDGVCAINLTWNYANAISGSHCDQPERGLSPLGVAFVRKAFALDILMDISHLSDQGVSDLYILAQEAHKPIIASHSNSRAVYGHSRNITDQQFAMVRDSGGFVGINLYNAFCGTDNSMDALMAHFDHFLSLDGEDTVALGSDWDGNIVGPEDITHVGMMYRLAEAFYKRNYPQALVEKIFYHNLATVLQTP